MKEYELGCRNIGVDCDAKFKAEDRKEVLKMISEHAAAEHNLPVVPPELQKKCYDSMKEIES